MCPHALFLQAQSQILELSDHEVNPEAHTNTDGAVLHHK